MVKGFRIFLLAAAAVLVSCDSSDSNGVPLTLYEGEVGEAVIDHLIATVPDPSPQAPKSWSIILGDMWRSEVYQAASVPFLEKFQEGGRRVISARVLSEAEPDHMIIDPELRVAVYLLQLRLMTQRSADLWDVEAAWSYKKFFQRLHYEVQKVDGKWTVVDEKITEGNWPPEEAAASPES